MNFKQWLLSETPLDFYGHQYNALKNDKVDGGAIDGWQGFMPIDKKLIESEKTRRKLENVLNRTPFHWNILFFEESNDMRNQVKEYLAKNKIPTQGRITFVKKRNPGDPLTPWMIAHNIGHALPWEPFAILKKYFKYDKDYNGDHEKGWFDDHIYEFLIRYLHFKSAKNTISGKGAYNLKPEPGEILNELIAEYLFQGGKIRLSPNPLVKPNIKYTYGERPPLPSWATQPMDQASLDKISKLLSDGITSGLKNSIGKIIWSDED